MELFQKLGETVEYLWREKNYDDTDLFVLESLLKDRNAGEMESALKSDYPNDDTTEIAKTLPERTDKIKSAVIFKPLFQ